MSNEAPQWPETPRFCRCWANVVLAMVGGCGGNIGTLWGPAWGALGTPWEAWDLCGVLCGHPGTCTGCYGVNMEPVWGALVAPWGLHGVLWEHPVACMGALGAPWGLHGGPCGHHDAVIGPEEPLNARGPSARGVHLTHAGAWPDGGRCYLVRAGPRPGEERRT